MKKISKNILEEVTCLRTLDEQANVEMFDIHLLTRGYYRIIIVVNKDLGLVDIKSNIKEINEQTLFDIESDIESLEAILCQADFVFSNFVFFELFNQDIEIMVATEYVDIHEYEQAIVDAQTEFMLALHEQNLDDVANLDEVLDRADASSLQIVHDKIMELNDHIDDVFMSTIFETKPVLVS